MGEVPCELDEENAIWNESESARPSWNSTDGKCQGYVFMENSTVSCDAIGGLDETFRLCICLIPSKL